MNRRDFLSLALPAALILPELLIPKRTIFLPPRGGWRPEDEYMLSLGYRPMFDERGVPYISHIPEWRVVAAHDTIYRFGRS